jgi:hypothetical protein
VKRVLVVHYSQSGQLTEILDSIAGPLRECDGIEVTSERLQPIPRYPFPWPFYRFLDVFPESVLLEPPALESLGIDGQMRFDLVILGYTVWYLSPSPPVTAFLRSDAAKVLKGVPVVTVVNARDKWLTAQERVKAELARLGARLIDHVAFVHQGNPAQHLATTLRWMWTGRKDPFWGAFPAAGVDPGEIRAASRFGGAIREALVSGEEIAGGPLLTHLGAVKVDEDTVLQERLAHPNFVFWAKLIRSAGEPGSLWRAPLLLLFSLYLGGMILAALPVVVMYKLFLRPFLRRRTERWVRYYEQPSGSSTAAP